MIVLAFSMGFPSQGFSAGLEKVGYKANPATACDAAEYGYFGRAIALGDLNGDGLDDLIVLRTATSYLKDRRPVIHYSKGGNDPFSDPPVILDNAEGISVTTADVNADGIRDLIILSDQGVDAFYGKPTKFNSSDFPDWSYYHPTSVFRDVSIMDGNADGIDDILIGAGGENKGYVFYGSTSGLPGDLSFDAIIEGSDVSDWGYQTESGVVYNYWIAGVGAAVAPDGEMCTPTICGIQYAIGAPNTQIDLNKNGYITEDENNMGAVMVGPRTQFLSCDKQSWTFCGYALGNAGDVNGDGQTDLILSAKAKSLISGILPPKVFVYLGKDPSSFARMDTAFSWAVEEPNPRNPVGPGFMTFGYKVGGAGDINGDGYGDIFITDYRYDTTGTNRSQTELGYWGRVYFWFGGPPSAGDPSGLGSNPTPGTADIKLNGDPISGGFGEAVAVGDINGDGYTDVVVGDPRGAGACWDYDLNQSRFTEVGLVWVYLSSFSSPLPTITITATDNTATEAGPTTGTFTVSRTGSTAAALTVYYGVTGTSTGGVDRNALSGNLSIPAGSSSGTVIITPINDIVCESDETVILTLSANAAYIIGSPSSATVTIQDNDCGTLPTVSIVATDNIATEAGPTTGTFTVSRTGSTAAALTVYYGVTGTSTGGSDRNALSGNLSIPAGSSSRTIIITPINDALVEGDETVVVTLSANVAYTVGTPSNATITIISND